MWLLVPGHPRCEYLHICTSIFKYKYKYLHKFAVSQHTVNAQGHRMCKQQSCRHLSPALKQGADVS